MRFGILLVFVSLAGCAVQQPPPLEHRHKGMELIDQGVIHLRSGQLEEAQASFEAAYEIGKLPEALDGLGAVAMLKGSPEVAIELFEAAYNEGEYPFALGNLALAHEMLGNLVLANQLYNRAIEEDPTNFRARGNFSVFITDYLDEREKAKSELLKAKAIEATPLLVHNQEVLENMKEKLSDSVN